MPTSIAQAFVSMAEQDRAYGRYDLYPEINILKFKDAEDYYQYSENRGQWDPCTPTIEQLEYIKKLNMANKSLRSIIKKIKTDYNDLILNEFAYTWRWLNEAYTRYIKPTFRSFDSQNKETKDKKFLKFLSKNTGKEWVIANGEVKPKELCSSYLDEYKIRTWFKKEYHQTLIDSGQLEFDPDLGEFVWHTIRKTLYSLTPTGRRSVKNISLFQTDLNPGIYCEYCSEFWVKEFVKRREEDSSWNCPTCFAKELSNDPLTLTSVLTDYHSHSKWKFISKKVNKEKSLPIGIELEVQMKTDSQQEAAWYIFQEQRKINPKWNEIYFEKDGSLAAGGFEIVSNPMTIEFAKIYWEKMLPVIKQVAAGWDVEKYNKNAMNSYGIHCTMHRNYWKDYHIARLTKFLDLLENRDFVWAISQRTNNYSADSQIASKVKPKLNEYHTFDKFTKKLEMKNKYQSVNLKKCGNLMEIRLFNSTLNFESFMKNMEFLDAFLAWCKETSFNISFKAFLSWLGTSPAHKYRYENLLAYLDRNAFYIKKPGNIKERMPNTFKQYVKGQRGQLELFFEEPTEDQLCV